METVESGNRGFDLISRRHHPEDPQTAIDVRFIEVKGRAHVGEIALTANEYKTAQRLGQNNWVCVVFHCATPNPTVNIILLVFFAQDGHPVRTVSARIRRSQPATVIKP